MNNKNNKNFIYKWIGNWSHMDTKWVMNNVMRTKIVITILSCVTLGGVYYFEYLHLGFYCLVAIINVAIRNFIGKRLDIDNKSLFVQFLYNWVIFFILSMLTIFCFEWIVGATVDTAHCDGNILFMDDTISNGGNTGTTGNTATTSGNTATTSGNTQTSGNTVTLSKDNSEGYNMKLEVNMSKDTGDQLKSTITNSVIRAVENVGVEAPTNIGLGTALGSVGAAVMKGSLPPMQKIGMVGGALGMTGAAYVLARAAGNELTKAAIDKHSKDGGSPSPEGPSIGSFLDSSEISSSLHNLLTIQLGINVLLFVIFVLLILLLFNKFISKQSSSKVRGLVINELTKREFNSKKAEKFFELSSNISNNFFWVIFIILSLNFVFLIFLSSYINYELINNLDYFVQAHYDTFKKSLFVVCLPCRHKFYSSFGVLQKKTQIRIISTENKSSKVRFSRENVSKVSEFLDNSNNNLVEALKPNARFIELIKEKEQDMSYMPDYVWVRSFENVNLINEELSLDCTNLELEYGISNMEEYKLGFEQILKGIDEKKFIKCLNLYYSTIVANLKLTLYPAQLIPAGFLYSGIVKLYLKHVLPTEA